MDPETKVPLGGEVPPPPPPGPAVAGPPVAYCMPAAVQTRPPRATFDRYKHGQSIGLGITQIVIGILCIIFNGVLIGVSYYGNGLGCVGHGFWCGLLFLVTGILGVVAGKKKTRCPIVAFMVMCIISAVFTISLLVVGIVGAATTDSENCYNQYGYSYGYYYYDYYPSYQRICYTVPHYQAVIAMESLLAILGFLEVVVAIWGSALTCGSGVCCCCSRPSTGVMPVSGYFQHNGQMIYISQTQAGPYVYAPQPAYASPQGMVPPPAYVQPAWTNGGGGPMFAQAPPAYGTNQAQPLWVIQPATANPGGPSADEANSIAMAPIQ